jgi:ABC-2 type transport system ATP-binding protein
LQPALTIENLTFSWGRRRVLSGVSLAVGQGEFVALLGPNGSGKSTILTIAAGLAPRHEGRVAWNLGGLEGLQPGHPDALGRIGVVFQAPSLDQTLSTRENLLLAARMAGLGRAEARRRAEELLALADLERRADERVRQLSGGMRRRVDLARALIHDPDVLLLDEPTVGLDHASFERFWARVAEVRRQKRLTILCATHRADEAARSDRLAMIARGQVVHVGTPEASIASLGADLLVLEAASPEAVAARVRETLGLVTRVTGPAGVTVEVPPGTPGANLVVRLVENLPAGTLDSISLRRPDLGDLFIKIAGGSLGGDGAEEAAA